MNIREFTTLLDGRNLGPTKNGVGWHSRCPAHDDRNPSLSYSEGTDGKLLVHCHAGCPSDAICSSLGIRAKDLFPDSPKPQRQARIVATYDYQDANSKLLYQVCRMEPKTFRQRRPDGNGGWIWDTKDVQKVLFRLREIVRDVQCGQLIFICEGEKDVLSAVGIGLSATCNSGGAAKNADDKKWLDSYTETFRAANVVIIADKDPSGRTHAAIVAEKLQGVAKSIRLLELPDIGECKVKDFYDWLNAGGTKAELLAMVEGTAEWNPAQSPQVEAASHAPMSYYDTAGKAYWIQDNRGVWIDIYESGMRRHLKQRGVSPVCPKDGFVSPLDCELNRIQLEQCVDYSGSLAGYSVGIVSMGGKRVLVKDSPRLIEPKAGECPTVEALLTNLFYTTEQDQLPYVLGWLKVAVESLRAGSRRPGQALAIAGEHDCGKSLFQNLTTQILGGRSAKPYRYMSGGTDFNGELFGAEHLMIEDDVAGSDLRTRRSFGARIKDITVNQVQSCHAKNRQAISLEPFWRLTITLNCEPENMMILPPLDQSLEDKVILLKAHKKPMPMPTGTEQQRAAFWAALTSELPAFIHSLNHYVIPPALRSERFGVIHYHHPDLLSAIDAMAPETRLLALIDLELFKLPTDTEWSGTAEQLETALLHSESAYHAKQLLNWPNATGTYLGRLAAKQANRVTYHRTNTKRHWTISKA